MLSAADVDAALKERVQETLGVRGGLGEASESVEAALEKNAQIW